MAAVERLPALHYSVVFLLQYNTIQNLFIKSDIQNSKTLAMNSYLPTFLVLWDHGFHRGTLKLLEGH